MLLKTILNDCCKFKSFVYVRTYFSEDRKSIEVLIKPRKNGRPLCQNCKKEASVYDTSQTPRKFESVPFLKYKVFFLYRRRRVQCCSCGVKAEFVPWAEGKHQLSIFYMKYLADWCRHLSWKETANKFHTSWHKVFESVRWVVEWGLKQRSLEDITAIGVDEIQWRKGHKYLTLVYQINQGCVRLLWIGLERTEVSFNEFFNLLAEKSQGIKFVCSDMWKPYLKVIKERIGQEALHVLDRFHIVARLNKALDEVRAEEHRKMKTDGYEPLLTKARWLLLKRGKNLTEKQEVKLRDLVQYNLKSIRAYFLKEDFQQLWEYVSPAWAGKFIDFWVRCVMLSKIEPMKKEARTIQRHKGLILNYFKAKKAFSSGIVEGLNNKVKLTTRKSYGFKTFKAIEIALYHNLGKLPEPPLITHRFF